MTMMGSVDISFTNTTQVAKSAQDTANTASEVAGNAQAVANNASDVANQASEVASSAQDTANSAAQTADIALQSANGKNTNYYGPDEPTTGKDGDLWFKDNGDGTKTVYQYINNAWSIYIDQNASDAAQAAADAQSAADNAAQLGSAAQSTANAAAEAAATAQQAAENAQQTANDAASAAADAQTAANNAASAASAAQTTANDAKTIGQTAQTTANSAVSVANSAQTTANDAKTIANNAATDASTATQNAQDAINQAQTAFDNAQDALTATDSLANRMTDAEGNISALQQTSGSFATRITDAEGNISTLTQTVSGLQETVSEKVDNETYNSFVTQTAQALQNKLSVQDAANTYATQSSLTQTADSLTSKITSVQTNLDNLSIGGTNLLLNSNFSDGLNNWTNWGTATREVKTINGKTYIHLSQNDSSQYRGVSQVVSNIIKNTTYTISYTAYLVSGTTMQVGFHQRNGSTIIAQTWFSDILTTTPTKYIHTFTTTTSDIDCFNIMIGNSSSPFEIYITDIKLEKGSKPTDWSPSPSDLATQSQISQLSDDINLRVQKNDVINQINISTEGILIDGSNLHITATTMIDNAVITSAMIKSVSASTITTGTLDASVVTVTKLNASNITTGTLSTNLLAAGSIDATKIKAGTLTTASGVFGDISASSITSGTLSADRIGANTITVDKLMIGDFTNYAAWPNKGSGLTSPWDKALTPDTTTYHTSVASFKIAPNTVGKTLNNRIPVNAGDKIYIDFYVKAETGWNGTNANSKFRIGDQLNNLLVAYPYNTAGTDWTHFTGVWTVTAGVTSLQISLGNDGTTGNIWIDDIVISKQVPAVLIQDGAVTASKIAAASIDASKIVAGSLTSASGVFGAISANNITTGTLNAANVTVTNLNASNISTGTLNAARIGAGTIDATKLSVSTLSAISANLGSVTAGTLTGVTINAGTFNSSGDRGSLTISQDSITTTKTTVSGSTTTVNHIETFGGSMLFDTQVNSTVISETLINAGSIVVTALGSTIINGNTITTTNISAANITSNITFNGTVNLTYGSSEVSALVSSGQIQSVSFWSTGASTFNQILTGNLTASRGGAINLNNGDIIGANGIYLNDAANVDGEGIVFPWSTSTNVLDVTQADCLRAYNGRLLLNGDVVHTEKSMMIANGYVVITPSSGNTPTYKTVSFGKTFPVVPNVVVTPNSTVPGTTVTGWGVTDVTTTGCKIWVTRTNTTDTGLHWVAVADNTNWTATSVG